MVEHFYDNDQLLGIVIRAEYHKEGISFFTEPEFSQQLGYMKRPSGYVISPHVHRPVYREVHITQETLFIRSGKVRIDFYSNDQQYLKSVIIKSGDVVLLANGGHGFEMLEQSEIIEVKQGPYAGDNDKLRFFTSLPEKIKFDH